MRLRILVFLFVWAGAAGPAVLRAQLSSPAFDPNCYQPVIGTPGVIDTIMGSRRDQGLGDGIINIGPSPDNPGGPGRLMFGGLAGDVDTASSYSAVTCGPTFDPHHISITQFKGFWVGSTIVFGHFRNSKLLDVLRVDSLTNPVYPRVYWADDQGNFDTSQYTTLRFQRKSFPWLMPVRQIPYHGYLTSDTVEDFVLNYMSIDSVRDTNFFALFKGGQGLYEPHGYHMSDQEAMYDTLYPGAGIPGKYYSANFRGAGRTDCVASDNDGNLFFYKNDPPFSLLNFANAMKDTFLSMEGLPRIINQGKGIAMPVFSKSNSLNSVSDLLLFLGYEQGQIRIFRGGPDFGSHRLTLDSTYTIHSPSHYDQNLFGEDEWGIHGLANCGDMTGTGNNVLWVGGLDFLTGDEFFYVLGDAIDDKVDMYFYGYIISGTLDTCTIDGDRLQDVAMGDPGYNMEGNLSGDVKGTVRFIHGTTKIPVRLNRNIVRQYHPELEGHLTISPNPCSTHTVVTWESACSGSVEVLLYDEGGRIVYRTVQPTTGDLESFSFEPPALPAGAYTLDLVQTPCVQQAKLIIQH